LYFTATAFAVFSVMLESEHLHVQGATVRALQASEWPRVKAAFVSMTSWPNSKPPSHRLEYSYVVDGKTYYNDYCNFYSGNRYRFVDDMARKSENGFDGDSLKTILIKGGSSAIAYVNPADARESVLDVSDQRSPYERHWFSSIMPLLVAAVSSGIFVFTRHAPKSKPRRFDYVAE
jgi:hypothetical protein